MPYDATNPFLLFGDHYSRSFFWDAFFSLYRRGRACASCLSMPGLSHLTSPLVSSMLVQMRGFCLRCKESSTVYTTQLLHVSLMDIRLIPYFSCCVVFFSVLWMEPSPWHILAFSLPLSYSLGLAYFGCYEQCCRKHRCTHTPSMCWFISFWCIHKSERAGMYGSFIFNIL